VGQVAGWLRRKPQAEQTKTNPFLVLTPASDGKPRQFIGNRCANLISELLEYREDVKENDHATDALRYSLPLEQEEKPFLYVVRR
jgi:hypothetical protein